MKSEAVGKLTMISALVASAVPFAFAAMMISASSYLKYMNVSTGSTIAALFVFAVVVYVAATIIAIVGCMSLVNRNISRHVRSTARVLGILLLVSAAVSAFFVCVTYIAANASPGGYGSCGSNLLDCVRPLQADSSFSSSTYVLGSLTAISLPLSLLTVEVTNIMISIKMGHFLSQAAQSRREKVRE